MTDVIGGEDCLFVNVYTPSLPQNPFGKKLPVMVYIHGGGFRIGSGNAEEFRTDLLVEKETIVVTLNYRLGVLGFLCLDVPEVPGNAGLKDQTLAMAWVKRNIKSFDGNPNNITIFGCSAGAASIEYQMLSPLSKGLFHKAILESGSTLNPWARNNNPSQLVKKLKTVLNVTINDNVVLIQHLQDLDVNELIKSANKIIDETAIKAGELFGFAPVVEKTFANVDTFLTAEPLEILKVGKFHKVPIITGFCSNEGSLFKLFYGTHLRNLKAEKYADYMTSFSIGIGDKPKMNSELATLYNSSNRSDNEKVDNYLSDMLFIAGIEKSLHYYLQHGVYGFCYLFSYKGSFEFNLAKFKNLGDGARHGSELLYLSKLPTINESEATAIDLKVRRQLVEMWTNFAKFGYVIFEWFLSMFLCGLLYNITRTVLNLNLLLIYIFPTEIQPLNHPVLSS